MSIRGVGEIGATAHYRREVEAAIEGRFHQIQKLGHWACHLMDASLEGEDRYQDMLCRLAISNFDDRVIVERVYRDLSAAGVAIPLERVDEALHTC